MVECCFKMYIIIESYYNDFTHVSSHEELWEAKAAMNQIYEDFAKARKEYKDGLPARIEEYLKTIRVPEFDPASSYWREWVQKYPVRYSWGDAASDPNRSTTPENFKEKLAEKLEYRSAPGWTGNSKRFILGDLHIVKVP